MENVDKVPNSSVITQMTLKKNRPFTIALKKMKGIYSSEQGSEVLII